MVPLVPSFVHQQMKMRIHDIMQHLSKKLGDIVKPMILNEIQKAREEECCHSQSKATTNLHPEFNLVSLGHWTYDRCLNTQNSSNAIWYNTNG